MQNGKDFFAEKFNSPTRDDFAIEQKVRYSLLEDTLIIRRDSDEVTMRSRSDHDQVTMKESGR